jgi:hypothetical protein
MKRKKAASRRSGSILSIDSYSLMGDPDATRTSHAQTKHAFPERAISRRYQNICT